jgi:hypothetical protein
VNEKKSEKILVEERSKRKKSEKINVKDECK